MTTPFDDHEVAELRRTLGAMEAHAPEAPELSRDLQPADRSRKPVVVVAGAAALTLAVLLPIGLLLRGDGGPTADAGASVTTVGITSVTENSATVSTIGNTTTTTSEPEGSVSADRAVRVYDIAGVEVVVRTETVDLPERATAVEFATMVIDSGAGPEICVSIVNDSLPPQCAGIVVDGLDMSGWAEQAQGVRWGERAVSVSWPPVDNHVQLLGDAPIDRTEFTYPPGEVPAACEGITRFVPVGVVQDYERGLGDRSGGLYVANNGVLVLQVTDDPEPHRQAMATAEAEACVIQVKWNETNLQRIKTELEAQLAAVVPHWSTISSGAVGRVDVIVAVADHETVRKVAALVDHPEAIRVIGLAILLDN